MNSAPRLVVILGPTACGKSALGVWLSERLGGEILACDSTQVYRHFNIGTAKSPVAEQRGIPHHLVDLAEPLDVFTAGEYRRQALLVLDALRGRGKLPILTVGTGLYLRALLEGLADAPARSEALRERLRRQAALRGPEYLYRVLARLDRDTAIRLAPQDTQKVIRVIEICLLAGKTVGELHRAGRLGLRGYQVQKIGLLPGRADLYARIEGRVLQMLDAGWLEEIRQIIARETPATAKPFQFIGYRQLREHLEGQRSREDAILAIQQATRRYAKRQLTWFRKEPGVRWFEGFGDAPEVQAAALAFLTQPATDA
jgi:tRNA dimethylallyltransferase